MNRVCPNCGQPLAFDMSYMFGEPYIVYKCSCGVTSEHNIKVSDSTDPEIQVLATDRTDYEVVF